MVGTAWRTEGPDQEFDEHFELLTIISRNIPRVLGAARRVGIPVVISGLGNREADPSEFQRATGWLWDQQGPDGSYPEAWRPGGAGSWSSPSRGVERPVQSGLRIVSGSEPSHQRGSDGPMLEYGTSQTRLELNDPGVASLVVSDGVAVPTRAGQDYVSGNIAHGLIKRFFGNYGGVGNPSIVREGPPQVGC